MTNSLTTEVATARELKRVLEYTGFSFELEEGPAPGGCRLRLASSAAHPWTCGHVRAHLLAEGITAEVAHLEDHSADPGGELVLTLSSEEEVQGLGRLLEARLTEVQNAALQLHRALAATGVERHVDIQTIGSRALIDIGTFDPDAATLLYCGLGGDESVLRGLDLTDWRDHERFAREVAQAVAATGRAQLVESVPVCGQCRERHGGNRIRFDYLDAEDTLHLANALNRNAVLTGRIPPS
ncbi:hypothetical protein [Streptomyces sp. NPDC013181]|uniref:hypothetical protein n=1 Tax=Streptomyces sp. NPDC013181 TaxID=3364864 RepID=UPI0036A7C38E